MFVYLKTYCKFVILNLILKFKKNNIMKTKILKIENVTIEKKGNSLIFNLPSNFGGVELKRFKEKHKTEIDQFKNS